MNEDVKNTDFTNETKKVRELEKLNSEVYKKPKKETISKQMVDIKTGKEKFFSKKEYNNGVIKTHLIGMKKHGKWLFNFGVDESKVS